MTTSATPAAGDGLPDVVDLDFAIEDAASAANLLSTIEDAVLVRLSDDLKRRIGSGLASYEVFAPTKTELDALRTAMRLVSTSGNRLRSLWEEESGAACGGEGGMNARSDDMSAGASSLAEGLRLFDLWRRLSEDQRVALMNTLRAAETPPDAGSSAPPEEEATA